MKPIRKSAIAFALAALSVTTISTDVDANDTISAVPLNAQKRHTTCRAISSFPKLVTERVEVVRGNTIHKIRIERHFVDVGLLNEVNVESCNNRCNAKVTAKGNFDRKGFAEIEFQAFSDAPAGDATLVLKYLGGGRGEYKLKIVRNSQVDRIQREVVSGAAERFILSGNNLDRLSNDFDISSNTLRLVSASAERLVLDRHFRNCSPQEHKLKLRIAGTDYCSILGVSLQMSRDATCGSGSSSPPAQAPPQRPPTQARSETLNLTPQVPNFVPFRSLSPTAAAADNTAARRQIFNGAFFCSGLAADAERTVNLPAIKWGIGYANLPANGAVSADVINADTGARLQRQTADAITQGNGSDIRLFENWTGRPNSVRVVNATSEAKRRAMGASAIGGNAAPPPPAGCYLAPSEPLSRFDPPRLIFRVNTGTPPLSERNANDNDLAL